MTSLLWRLVFWKHNVWKTRSIFTILRESRKTFFRSANRGWAGMTYIHIVFTEYLWQYEDWSLEF
jgi:hypothetical protein